MFDGALKQHGHPLVRDLQPILAALIGHVDVRALLVTWRQATEVDGREVRGSEEMNVVYREKFLGDQTIEDQLHDRVGQAKLTLVQQRRMATHERHAAADTQRHAARTQQRARGQTSTIHRVLNRISCRHEVRSSRCRAATSERE